VRNERPPGRRRPRGGDGRRDQRPLRGQQGHDLQTLALPYGDRGRSLRPPDGRFDPPSRRRKQLLAASVTDEAAAPYFREFFLDARRANVAELWNRALARGEVNPSISAGTATDLLFGPLIFRLMTGHAPLTEQEADAIATAALHGLLIANPAGG
jgi:hypothetical protein